jgi:hypothetical protein
MTDNYSTTLNAGSFKGRCYRHVRITKPHTQAEVWWVLDDGNYFKSLDALVRFVTVRQIADAAKARIACEAGETVACPDQHLCRHGIDN